MASAWGLSWGSAWGSSWGASSPIPAKTGGHFGKKKREEKNDYREQQELRLKRIREAFAAVTDPVVYEIERAEGVSEAPLRDKKQLDDDEAAIIFLLM